MKNINTMLKIRRNIPLFKINHFFDFFWPMSAVTMIYFQQILDSYSAAALVFSVWMMVRALFTVPAGIISDKWSRKKTLLVGGILQIGRDVCFALAGTMGNPTILFIGAIVWGLGTAFRSGAEEALMFETLTDLRKSHKYDIVFSAANFYKYLGAGLAVLIAAGITYFWNLEVLAWVSAFVVFFRLIPVLFFVEPNSYQKSMRKPLPHLISAFKYFLKNRRMQKIAGIDVLSKSSQEIIYRLGGFYYVLFVPVWAVNLLTLAQRFATSAGYYIALHLRRIGILKMAAMSSIFRAVWLGIALLLNNIVSTVMVATASVSTGAESSARESIIQHELSNEERATMYSILTIMSSSVGAVGLWLFGIVMDMYSVQVAMYGAFAMFVMITLYYKWLGKSFYKEIRDKK